MFKKTVFIFLFFLITKNAVSYDTSNLSPQELKIFNQVMETAYSYRECSDTINKCLQDEKTRKYAKYPSEMVFRLVKQGKNAEQIQKAILNRAKSHYAFKTYKIDLSDSHPYGQKQGVSPLIHLVEYGDFQCPSCAQIAAELHKIIGEMNGQIILHFKHFCVKGHDRAIDASRAAIAAEKQGFFWKYYFHLYQNRSQLDIDDLLKYAEDMKADLNKFKEDMNKKQTLDRLRQEKREGLDMGVDVTPTLFINGKKYLSEKNYDELKAFLEEELEILSEEGH